MSQPTDVVIIVTALRCRSPPNIAMSVGILRYNVAAHLIYVAVVVVVVVAVVGVDVVGVAAVVVCCCCRRYYL